MVRIQLENGYLNVKYDVKFPLNFGVADIRDISKRSGTFSKTIKLIGDDNNNNLLGHYYDVNIQAGTFNIDTLTKCAVIQNDVPIIEDCVLQLISIDKEQHSDGHDEKVEYSVLIKDAQSDFFTKLDNSELTELDFTDLNHVYNSTNVITSFTHTVTDGYVYPVTANPSNSYPLTEFNPAIYAQLYFDRIHAAAGFSYEWTDITTDNFSKAVIPYNGEEVQVDYSDYIVQANKSSFFPTLGSAITSWTETQDNQGLFNPTTGVYTPPFYIDPGQAIDFEFSVDLDIELVNATGSDAYLVDMLTTGATQGIRYTAKAWVYVNGALSAGVDLGFGEFETTDNPLANGTTVLASVTATGNVPLTGVLPTDSVTIVLDEELIQTGSVVLPYLKWKDANSTSGNDVTITTQFDVTSFRMAARVSVNSLGFGQTVNMNDFIPKKIKQKDFIKWVLFRWNLFVELDPDNPNKFIYKTRDSYYDDGAEVDWTYKLSKERTHQVKFLPELSAKKILLTDKLDDDPYNDVYHEATNEVYGQLEFTYTNEYVKGVDKKETIFSPTPMIRTIFNAVVPSFVGSAPKNSIRLLLHNGTDSCDTYNIVDYGSVQTAQTVYPIVSHFDDNENPTFDLNFGVCDYYFYQGFTKTNNNMYNLYWRRTINQINTGKMFIGWFDLNEDDIQKLALSDKIRIDNSWWNINRVIDYDANGETLTKVELLSVDTEIDLTPFQTKDPNEPTPVITLDPFPDLAAKYYQNNNTNYSEGSTKIYGVGNTVEEGIKAVVVGDGGYIDSDGFWLNGVKIEVPSADCQVIDINADYTVTPGVDCQIVSTVGGLTVTLPDPDQYKGKTVSIKHIGTGRLRVETSASTIDNRTFWNLRRFDNMQVRSRGTTWIII